MERIVDVGRVMSLKRAGLEVVVLSEEDVETILARGMALFIFVLSQLDDQPLTQEEGGGDKRGGFVL